ncbi:hypothetical protein G7054_g7477 [Neopestalotiopsis clavispora]|nr:hypothetical protein G7054_g7477 [Neopestalotiopsis clavispora]
MAAPNEKYYSSSGSGKKPYVSHGLPFHEACRHHAETTFGATRIYVVVSSSISRTQAFSDLQKALGSRLTGVRYGMAPHTPWKDVFEVTRDILDKKSDLIITLGGGSLTDGIKLARLLAANGITDFEGLKRLREPCKIWAPHPSEDEVKPATIPCVNVPTTLSGGEYTNIGGATDTEGDGHKTILQHESMLADIVVLDPALTVSTPERFWLSTGVRGIDHCCEGLYENLPSAFPETSADLVVALEKLLVNLLRTKKNWEDPEARLQEMLVVKECPRAISNGLGASHGIGHQLGPLGVGHGETSCVMLAHVLKYNWQRGDDHVRRNLQRVVDVFWKDTSVVEVLEARGLRKESADPGDLVGAFVAALGLPTTLGHFGIGEDKFDDLAEVSLHDWCTEENPIKLDKEQVLNMLRLAA